MGLSFYLADTAGSQILGTLEPRLALEDEGLTGVLAAVAEFVGPSTAHGGPTLDENGTNVFGHADLLRLRGALRSAAAQFSAGPPVLRVWVGTEVVPVHRTIFQDISRLEILGVLGAIQGVVEEAIAVRAWLFAVGD